MLCAGRKRRYTDVAPPDESSGGKVSGSDLYNSGSRAGCFDR
mgnify:CR=1 FL=1